ncbi:ATP-binding protein [Galbitalea sp. SE-J8]|uniref:sensor histidine kinase n=1 Tax=Galbitalea sp. SE-J8 TaxID=3054952 RepID=UPI00259D025E|nr:ATP-binding protein [Galbitalea sp. SE-J8]MDM4762446.1 ATP-binding protein [Galbitalea sp. SE-J8]
MLALEASGEGTAVARMTRILFVGTAAFGLAFTALATGSIVAQWRLLAEPYAITIALVLGLGPIVLIAIAGWAPLGAVRAVAAGYLIAYSSALVTWPAAQRVDRIPDGSQPWVITLLPMAVFAAAVLLGRIGAWVALVGLCLVAGGLRYVADGARSLEMPVEDTLFNVMTIAVFVAIIIVTLRAGRRRDETARATAQDAVLAAAAEAQDLQRAHVAALTHDDVLSTLLAAARSTEASVDLVRRHARRALDRLAELGADPDDHDLLVSTETLVASLRDTVAALSGDVRFVVAGAETGTLPGVAARTLVEATAEAVRNTLRHAGSSTDRRVTVSIGADAAAVEVRDDGPGFDPLAVPEDRFGVRFSITHRMSLVSGGSAIIDSAPGTGTRIRLVWRPDDAGTR